MSNPDREWTINDAVTENLDLPELLRDYLSQLSPKELGPAFGVLRSLTVCDPTVGSGAFLFAALDVLEPLYLEVVERAKELRQSGQLADEPAFLREAEAHPSQRYWLLKTICLHNLYGVDIMHEAPEIAKLRLFLKLAAQIDNVDDLEPLPDLDFNIKCGNLLVGIANPEDATNRLDAGPLGQRQLDWGGNLAAIQDLADHLAQSYDHFVTAQVESPGQDGGASSVGLGTPDSQDLPSRRFSGEGEAKRALEDEFRATRERCDELLHRWRDEPEPLEAWVASHQPFHWFVEFPSVWRSGGFDVIIGNPPYINTKDVTGYRWINYQTQKCPNLYAVCVERATTLLKPQGRFAMIVLHSLCFRSRFGELRSNLTAKLGTIWVSSFDRTSDSLFSGTAKVRNTILIAINGTAASLHLTRCHGWLVAFRPHLFSNISYMTVSPALCGLDDGQWPFIDDDTVASAFVELVGREQVSSFVTHKTKSSSRLGYRASAYSFLPVWIDPPPSYDPCEVERSTAENKWLYLDLEATKRDILYVALAGRWGYLWWLALGDAFHVTRRVLESFPFDISSIISSDYAARLVELSHDLQSVAKHHLTFSKRGPKDAQWRIGSYERRVSSCRAIADQADWLLARSWGIEWAFEAAGNLRDRMTFGTSASGLLASEGSSGLRDRMIFGNKE